VKLRTIGHSRSGDKGNVLNISLIAFDERDYPRPIWSTGTSSGTSCPRLAR
jgi:hypothetical protein